MLVFPHSKINLGLNIVNKRSDGYHNIETVFYPISWCDALEVIENKHPKSDFEFHASGLNIDGPLETNLIYKAYQLVLKQFKIPPIQVYLHKNIPMGAGLGGGSADAAFFIRLLDHQFNLKMGLQNQYQIAEQLGSDCAFFVESKAVFASERGNVFESCAIDLSQYYILIIYPNIHSQTKEAYEGVLPKASTYNLKQTVESTTIETWKELIKNDFEPTIFKKYPAIKILKEQLYQHKALYASLSGSGSAVFGIFKTEPPKEFYQHLPHYLQIPHQINL